jgi:hypothetical protein
MPKFKDQLLFSLLGLEEEPWSKVNSAEQAVFGKLLGAFILISLLILITSIGNVYLISSSWAWAVGGGLLISFVFWNIVRFTMLTIRTSPIEINLEELDRQYQPIAKVDTKRAPTLGPFSGIHRFLMRGGHGLGQHWETMRGKLGDWFGFGRWLLYGIFMLIISIQAFPMAFLFMKTRANEFNDQYRSTFLAQWKQDHEAQFEGSLKDNRREIDRLEKDLITMQRNGFPPDNPYYQQKLAECNAQKAKVQDRQAKFTAETENLYAALWNKNKDKYFLVSLIGFLTATPLYKGVYLILAVLYALPLVLLFQLKGNPKFSYFRESAKLFKETIDQDYLVYKENIKDLCRPAKLQKVGISAINPEEPSVWLDPPFRTRYAMKYKPKPEVELQFTNLV